MFIEMLYQGIVLFVEIVFVTGFLIVSPFTLITMFCYNWGVENKVKDTVELKSAVVRAFEMVNSCFNCLPFSL